MLIWLSENDMKMLMMYSWIRVVSFVWNIMSIVIVVILSRIMLFENMRWLLWVLSDLGV